MTDRLNHRISSAKPQPSKNVFDADDWFIDDEFDDFLDLQVAAIRESLADFRNFQ